VVFALVSDLGRRLWNYLLAFVRRRTDVGVAWTRVSEFHPDYSLHDFSSDYELVRLNWEESEKMRFYRRDYTIGRERYIPAEMRGKTRFQTVFEATVRNVRTGEVYETGTTVFHNRTRTRGELEEAAEVQLQRYEPETEVIRIMPSHGYRDLAYPGEYL
jgi:hypothetical protein